MGNVFSTQSLLSSILTSNEFFIEHIVSAGIRSHEYRPKGTGLTGVTFYTRCEG
jgi:hypothetical protein